MTSGASLQFGALSLLLVGIGVAAIPLMRAEQHDRKLRDRLAQNATPYARATLVEARDRTSATAAMGNGRVLLQWLIWLVAFDPAHRSRYPLPWWIVVPAALVFSRLLVALGQTLFGSSMLLALPVVWLLSVRQFYRRCELTRLRMLFEQFPDALAMLVRAVRVGIPITEGMRNIAADSPEPTRTEFAQIADQLSLGVALDQALQGLAERNKLPEYGFFATALSLQSETGGTVSDTLERLADVIRKRVSLREHARALASEARTSIMILAALPVCTGLALAAINPDYISTLFVDPQGRRIFTLALGSLSMGIFSMRTIVSRSLR
jgi:tight adherence protein B